VLQQVLDRYPDKVKMVVKHFPLSSHKFARKAASAALAANLQGKFWEFHVTLLKNYNALNDSKIKEIAQSLGLDMEKFSKDMRSPAVRKLITRDINNGRRIGVRGTPTVFINGKRVQQRSSGDFVQRIEAELKKKR